MPDANENALTLEKASQGALDPEDFAAQYDKAYSRLHLIALSIIGDATHAHDLVQEAAVIALQKADKYIPGASYVAWLAEIVRRSSLNYVRKVRGRRTMATDPEILAESRACDQAPEAKLPVSPETGELTESQIDFDDETLKALYEITPDARCCLLLRVVHNMSYVEIAELMQIPEGTAMSHVHRSRKQLRRRLASKHDRKDS